MPDTVVGSHRCTANCSASVYAWHCNGREQDLGNCLVWVNGDSFVCAVMDNHANFTAGFRVYNAGDNVHPPHYVFLGNHEPDDTGNVLYAHSRLHGDPPIGRYIHSFRGPQVVPPVARCSGNLALG